MVDPTLLAQNQDIAPIPAPAPGPQAGPPDMTGIYNTPLSPQEEAQFQRAYQGKMGDLYNYDLRGAFKAGVTPDSRGHLPDTYKKPNHPTFSTDSKYNGVAGNEGGEWSKQPDGKWQFEAGLTNLKMHGADALKGYFKRVEPDAVLIVPAGK